MADIKINGATPSAFYFGSTAATAVYYGSTKLWPSVPPVPVLPANTIRAKFTSDYMPGMGDAQTLVDSSENIWDIYKSGTDWNSLFVFRSQLEEVIAANTTGVTNMKSMFYNCSNLTSVPLFDTSNVTTMEKMFSGCSNLASVPLFNTSSVTNMNSMFNGCVAVESGALALYQQASTQANPPTYHTDAFKDCGSGTVSGSAELAQIPSSWGGTGS